MVIDVINPENAKIEIRDYSTDFVDETETKKDHNGSEYYLLYRN
jgi:hypothetical protein